MENFDFFKHKTTPKEKLNKDISIKLTALEREILSTKNHEASKLNLFNLLSLNEHKFWKIQNKAILMDFSVSLKEIIKDQKTIIFFWQETTVHKFIAEKLKIVESEIKNSKFASKYKVKTVGSFNIRNIHSELWNKFDYNNLSAHSLWLAIDINEKDNKIEEKNTWKKISKSFKEFVEIMKKAGFIWWWDWDTPYDPMHFEFTNRDSLNISMQVYREKISKN